MALEGLSGDAGGMRKLPPGSPLDKARVVAILLRGFDPSPEVKKPWNHRRYP